MRNDVRNAIIVALLALFGVTGWAVLHRRAYLNAVAADARSRGVHPDSVRYPDTWPMELFREALVEASGPAEAEAAVRADSVRYFVVAAAGGSDSTLHQLFHVRTRRWAQVIRAEYDVRFRHGPMVWPMVVEDPRDRLYAEAQPLSRDEALAWHRARVARRRAELLGRADSLNRLMTRLAAVEGHIRLAGDSSSWYLEEQGGVVSGLWSFDDVAVRRLVECLDDARPSGTRLGGRPVAVGVVCHGALAGLTFRGRPSARFGRVVRDEPGHVHPLATADELRAAQAVWEDVYRRGDYRLQ
jgi:hypothetical protein